MRITMIDDSVPFDGTTADRRALGGAERAFAGLAAALARRGHAVTAVNRCQQAAETDGVQWVPWDLPRPPYSDVLVAFRQPRLLAEVDDAAYRILWMWGPPQAMNKPTNQAMLERYSPIVAFVGDAQRRAWKSWRDFRQFVVVPGTSAPYLNGTGKPVGGAKRIAVVTTHPLNGLKEIVRLWRERIFPACDNSALHIYSAVLVRHAAGVELESRLSEVAEDVSAAVGDGVSVQAPAADSEMAAAYRAARVHLYPARASEMYCATLAESQAVGLPAVVRVGAEGNDAIDERIRNGQTGYAVPDDDAFVNVTVELMTNDLLFESISRDARLLQSVRGWDAAAMDFEMLWVSA